MGWFSRDDDQNTNSVLTTVNSKLAEFGVEVHPPSAEFLQDLPWQKEHSLVMGTACLFSFALGAKVSRMSRSLTRKTSAHNIASVGPDSPVLRGKVLSVSDGDTFRFYHRPTIFHSATPPKDAKLSDISLPVRVATIDTPETAKFGKPSQPFGDEAKQFLSDRILDKTVSVQVLMKDQYGRAVAQVQTGPFFWKSNIDELMLSNGLAEVYLGGGAVYGSKGKEAYLKMQQRAKKNKIGIWSDPNRESAAEFKARMKEK